MDFLTPQAQVLAWTIFIFAALVGLLWKFAWGPLMKALEEREARIAKRISDADARLKAAEERVAEYERKIAGAKEEAAGIIAEGKRDVEKVAEEIRAAAQAEAARSLERAKREIQLAKEAAIHELRERMVGLVAQAASQVIRREVKADDHRRFIEESIAEVEKSAR